MRRWRETSKRQSITRREWTLREEHGRTLREEHTSTGKQQRSTEEQRESSKLSSEAHLTVQSHLCLYIAYFYQRHTDEARSELSPDCPVIYVLIISTNSELKSVLDLFVVGLSPNI
jgi:hypothetical protein